MSNFDLTNTANIITIIGGIVALVATGVALFLAGKREYIKYSQANLVENYLKKRREGYMNGEVDSYQHTLDHLIVNLRLSREEIFEAARRRKTIQFIATTNPKGMADGFLFQYGGPCVQLAFARPR